VLIPLLDRRPIAARLKRAVDIIVAAAVLVLACPLMLVIIAASAFVHRSTGLFKDVRVGRYGRVFTMWKIQTMRDSRNAQGMPLPDQARVTSLGAFLRKTSLDELPQLWNILEGDVSLVGPRPLPPRYAAYFNDVERSRLLVPPGITGWAQVHGRNLLDWGERLALDVWYVRNWSPALDCRILWLTFWQVLAGRSNAVTSSAVMPDFDQYRLEQQGRS